MQLRSDMVLIKSLNGLIPRGILNYLLRLAGKLNALVEINIINTGP